MPNFVLQYGIWIGTAILQLGLACILLRQNLRKEFPAFFTYTVYEALSVIPLLLTFHFSRPEYLYAYSASGIISIALGFAVVYEIFRHAFRPYASLRELGAVLFRWVLVFLVLVAIVLVLATPGDQAVRLVAGIMAMQRSIRLMQVGLVLLLFIFLPHLGLSWRSHIVGIALGFGFYAAIEMVVVTLAPQVRAAVTILNLVNVLGYAVTVGLWTFYIASPEPARRPVLVETSSERWNHTLSGLHHEDAESFLPLLEARVERVMTRHRGELAAN